MREHLAMRPLTVESPHYFDQLPTQPPEHDDGDDYELSVPAPNGRAAGKHSFSLIKLDNTNNTRPVFNISKSSVWDITMIHIT